MVGSSARRMRNSHAVKQALPHAAILAGLAGAAIFLAQAGNAQPAAEIGAEAYANECATCHGAMLAGGQFGPALKGDAFIAARGGSSAAQLLDKIRTTMPPANVGGLDDAIYADIVQLILDRNGVKPGVRLADAGAAQLDAIILPRQVIRAADAAAQEEQGVGGVSKRFPLVNPPVRPDRFAHYTPVTQAMLSDPVPGDWLTWRRSHKGLGFTPLADVTPGNVGRLRLAWSLALPAGPLMNEPLVRDGVLYIDSFGDEVFALDATDGHVLWRYRRELPQGTGLGSRKTIALYGDKLFVATSDLHLVALDARTGKLMWDSLVTDRPGFRNPGGPLAADGVVMQGLTTQAAGGSLIAGFDAETGRKLWTFNTVAQPDEPGGDTWNGLAAQQRSGGSSWTSGTYDAASGIAFFGTGATYDTGPLRNRKPGLNNDALYTDATLGLDPKTGALRWYFQHMKNDQWDLDWVFDRVIGELDVSGQRRRVVMTAGKEGLFDILAAENGKYLGTVDMGLQNFVTAIDPITGDKTIDPALVPDGSKTLFVCPHGGGGRNWGATAFNEATGRLFVVARDVCMDMVPSKGTGFLSTGVNIEYAPPPGSDGNYGILQGLDMVNRKVAWEVRQRAPYNTGVLATATGLLFTGSVDREIMAYDQASGRKLWHQGLPGVPNAAPISYAVNGRQYVAFVTGHGNPLSGGVGSMTPEIELPPVANSGVFVYALDE
jgi:alcohol dehydrogenase (cytochrome c)